MASTSSVALPSGIKSYEAAVAAPKAKSTGASQQDFLKLFTTQLQNQNPLDPTKNEAFVAQLAQFSQLEATTNMANQLTSMASTMSGDRMMSSAALIGKSVIVPGASFDMTAGNAITGNVALPTGADGITIDVLNSNGESVKQQILGAQPSGDLSWTWSGADNNGNAVADGTYTFRVTGVSQGKTIAPEVNQVSAIRSVSQNAKAELVLEVQGGKTVNLADVKRFGG
jgi:flagellar basal-body rod modification protein FlgD